MSIAEYVKEKKLSIAMFSQICGLCLSTGYNYYYGEREPTLENAVKIVQATAGAVTYVDLLPIWKRGRYILRAQEDCL